MKHLYTNNLKSASGKKPILHVNKVSPKGYANEKIALQLYSIAKEEIKTKRVAKLPKNDFRRRAIKPKQNVIFQTILQQKTSVFDLVPVKKFFAAAFSALPFGLNKA